MKRQFLGILASATYLCASNAASAQIPTGQSNPPQTSTPATTGSYSSENVGVMPILGMDGSSFSAAASDANRFQIAASRLCAMRSERSDVKDYARRLRSDSETAQKALNASLSNEKRRIARPTSRLSAERASMLKLLRNMPRSGFDTMYLTQSAQVQQANWAVHKGYAVDGADSSLSQVAGNGVPVIEEQLRQGNALLPVAYSAPMLPGR